MAECVAYLVVRVSWVFEETLLTCYVCRYPENLFLANVGFYQSLSSLFQAVHTVVILIPSYDNKQYFRCFTASESNDHWGRFLPLASGAAQDSKQRTPKPVTV